MKIKLTVRNECSDFREELFGVAQMCELGDVQWNIDVDLNGSSSALGIFVRHQKASGLDAKFLRFLVISDDRRKQVGRIKVTTVFETVEDFFRSLIPASQLPTWRKLMSRLKSHNKQTQIVY